MCERSSQSRLKRDRESRPSSNSSCQGRTASPEVIVSRANACGKREELNGEHKQKHNVVEAQGNTCMNRGQPSLIGRLVDELALGSLDCGEVCASKALQPACAIKKDCHALAHSTHIFSFSSFFTTNSYILFTSNVIDEPTLAT